MKKSKIPKSLGACADLLAETRAARLALAKQVEELQAFESEIREHIIKAMPKTDSGAAGKQYRVSVVVKEKPVVRDWDAFYAYVAKTKQFDMLQRRASEQALMDRLESGKKIPGTEVFNAVTVSLNKL